MISLAELKTYLDITDTVNDIFLNNCINSALGTFESECNRKLIRQTITENIYDYQITDLLFLQSPIVSISSLKYFDGESYIDLIDGSGDTIANTIEINSGYAVIRKGYSFYGKDLQVSYTAGYKFQTGTGTITGTAGSSSVVGTSTLFSSEIIEDVDYISCEGERIKVDSISSNTALTLVSPFVSGHAGKTFTVSNVPEDLRQGMLKLSAMLFYESAQGQSLLIKSSEGVNSGSSMNMNYKELDLTKLYNMYRFQNV